MKNFTVCDQTTGEVIGEGSVQDSTDLSAFAQNGRVVLPGVTGNRALHKFENGALRDKTLAEKIADAAKNNPVKAVDPIALIADVLLNLKKKGIDLGPKGDALAAWVASQQ